VMERIKPPCGELLAELSNDIPPDRAWKAFGSGHTKKNHCNFLVEFYNRVKAIIDRSESLKSECGGWGNRAACQGCWLRRHLNDGRSPSNHPGLDDSAGSSEPIRRPIAEQQSRQQVLNGRLSKLNGRGGIRRPGNDHGDLN
jgi:hypothetical protein